MNEYVPAKINIFPTNRAFVPALNIKISVKRKLVRTLNKIQ